MSAPRRFLTPLQVPCSVCGANPLMACTRMPWERGPRLRDLPHDERVWLADARNRMRRREDGTLRRARRAFRRWVQSHG